MGHRFLSRRPQPLVQVGRAMFPEHERPHEPYICTWERGEWYLDGALLLCVGCGCDGT